MNDQMAWRLVWVLISCGWIGSVAAMVTYFTIKNFLDQISESRKQAEKLAMEALAQIRSMQRDQSTIISELVAAKTLAETGSQLIASQMLQHSNAHDLRDGQGQVTPGTGMPTEPEPDEPQGPHLSPELAYGADDEIPPMPGEE